MMETMTLEGCQTLYELDLQKNKKQAWLVNGFGFLLFALMFLGMFLAMPLQMMRWGMEQVGVILWFLMLLGAVVLCGLLLALLRKITLGTKKAKEGLPKGSYMLLSLLPVTVVALLLIVAQILVPVQWCWFVFLVQMVNVAGAAQELFVAVRLLFLPKHISIVSEDLLVKVYLQQV